MHGLENTTKRGNMLVVEDQRLEIALAFLWNSEGRFLRAVKPQEHNDKRKGEWWVMSTTKHK